MATAIKRLLVGRALKTEQAAHERLTKKTALAVFSSDALSSTAYATEEILLVLAVAAAATANGSFSYVVPISIGIAALLAIVATSYRQTIHAYPSGGGAYIVAKDNLGTTPGLVAAASLLVDYVLTVSVSIAAGCSDHVRSAGHALCVVERTQSPPVSDIHRIHRYCQSPRRA
jgi:amino acid transporter